MVANKVPSRVNDSVHSFVEHCRTCSWNRWKIVNSNYTSVHSGNKVHIWVGPRTRPSQNFSTTLWLVHSSLHTIYTHAHVEIETLTSTDAQQAAGIFFRIQQGARKLLQAWFRGTAAPLLNWKHHCSHFPHPTDPYENVTTHAVSLRPRPTHACIRPGQTCCCNA